MRTVFVTTALSGAAMLAAVSAQAALNDWDVRSRTIPASACTPRDSAQSALVEMVQGAWRFAGTSTGRVTFTCPFPISAFPADQAQGAGTSMGFYRVWYRDADGAGPAASLVVTPYVRLAPGGAWSNIGLVGGGGGVVLPGVCQFLSNAHPDMTFMATVQTCGHDLQYNALYSFEVVVSRSSPSAVVEFHGIDFVDGQGPAG
jgi:hypothetical protein